MDKFPTYVKMKLETELTTANLVILKVVKKKFFEKKKKENFCLPRQSFADANYVEICLGIYVGICCMPTRIAGIFHHQQQYSNVHIFSNETCSSTTVFILLSRDLISSFGYLFLFPRVF